MSAPLTTVHLIRHGSVVGAETQRFIGHLDVPLSPLGETQCGAVASRLSRARLVAVYTSDLLRSRTSGAIIGAPASLTPLTVPALREMAMGRWDGLTADEIRAREPVEYERWTSRVGEFPFPEGESVPDLIARAWPAFVRIVDAHVGGAIAVVAHGGTNRAILCRALGLPLDRLLAFGQGYGARSVLERAGEHWRLRMLNEAPL